MTILRHCAEAAKRARLERIVRPHTFATNVLHVCHTVGCESATDLNVETEMQPKFLKSVSAAIGAVGLALLVLMVTTEGEPGALPLALLLLSAIGYVTGRMRERSSR